MSASFLFMNSPTGPLKLTADASGLTSIEWVKTSKNIKKHSPDQSIESIEVLHVAKKQIAEYFQGKRRVFDLPLNPTGTTFQKTVWRSLQQIPFGTAISYGELAQNINKPTASRAVGAANGKNPLPIVIPCHRVIGADKKLTGFAGGIKIKAFLLDLENVFYI